MHPHPQLVLASASPRRSELLTQIGVPHRVLSADIDERSLPGESAEACVQRLARLKALAVQSLLQAELAAPAVLAADTVVLLGHELMGKPRDRSHALAMLMRLSDRTHSVLSAVALAHDGQLRCALSRSEVRFRRLQPAECEAYWDSGEPRDKAGAYAIQGLAAVFVQQLSGSYSGVMGLPLAETAALLSQAGIALWVR